VQNVKYYEGNREILKKMKGSDKDIDTGSIAIQERHWACDICRD
jgi:hypothetical protein